VRLCASSLPPGRARRAECRLPRARQAAEHEKGSESQIAALNQDRDAVRQRVEKMLQQMDELL